MIEVFSLGIVKHQDRLFCLCLCRPVVSEAVNCNFDHLWEVEHLEFFENGGHINIFDEICQKLLPRNMNDVCVRMPSDLL